jgi:hypothetical protein
MRVERLKQSVLEQAEEEYARSVQQKNRADIDYIAVMSDIDIMTDEDEMGMAHEEAEA